MPKAAKPLPELSDAQRALIEARYFEPPDVLLQLVFPDQPDLDTRSLAWKAIRAALALIGKAPKIGEVGAGGKRAPSIPSITGGLTTEQQAYVAANYKDASGPVELCRTLFEDETIMSNDPRVGQILKHIRKIDTSYRREDEPVDEMDYQPPKSMNILVGRLNRYGIAQRPDGKALGDGGLTAQERRALDTLLTNMRRSVFKVEADKFTKKIDRDVFEETFIGTTWGKLDLSHDHVLQYLVLASLSAQRNATDRMMRTLDERFLLSLEDGSRPLAKNEVEALKETKNAAAEHLKQINTLIKTLEGERRTMAAQQREGSASMHPIVTAWKTKEGRERAMSIANKYKQELGEEVNRLAGMEAFKAEIFGINPNTILN